MKARGLLILIGVLIQVATVCMTERYADKDCALGVAIVGMIALLVAHGLVAGVADRDPWIVGVAVATVGCICVVLFGDGGVAKIILEALPEGVAWNVPLAAAVAGLGGVLAGIGLAKR